MLKRVRFVVVVVVLCVGEVALLGAEAVEEVRPSGTGDGREDVGFGELSDDPVPDSGMDAADAARSASRCSSSFDNGTPADTSDDYVLHSSRVLSDGSRRCVYRRVVETVRDPVAEPCSSTLTGGYRLDDSTADRCVYTRTAYTERDATKRVTYSCDPRTGWAVKRNGDECVYTKEETLRLAPIPAVYVCDPVEGYGPGRLNGRTCTYTRSGSTTLPAKVTKRYRCPSAPATFKFSRIDDIRSKCLYTRSGETTRLKQWIPMYGYVGPCPKAPATFTYSKREGITCYYTRSTSTERGYEEYETYTCPPAPDTYTPAGRTGKTCKYTRSTSTTKPATRKTISRCPPVPSGYRWGHRSGNDCYYNMTVTETKPARGTTTYSCRSNENLVGTKCQKPRSGGTTTPRVYDCPAARTGETLTKSGSGKTTTCTYKKNETRTITKPPPPPPPPKPLATPTGVKANGDSIGAGGAGRSAITWNSVSRAKEYTVVVQPTDGSNNGRKTWTGTTSSVTIQGLVLNRLYSIRVQAHRGGVRSGWSKSTYTYPTLLPAKRGDKIGIVPIIHYRSGKSYNYILCTNQSPDTVNNYPGAPDQWRSIITKAAATWGNSTNEVSTKATDIKECQDKELDPTQAANIVRIMDDGEVVGVCNRLGATACAISWGSSAGEVDDTFIAIYASAGLTNDGKLCSELFRITMHEIGHAFGLAHPNSHPDESVMNMPDDRLCSPTAYDVVATKAIYQSR